MFTQTTGWADLERNGGELGAESNLGWAGLGFPGFGRLSAVLGGSESSSGTVAVGPSVLNCLLGKTSTEGRGLHSPGPFPTGTTNLSPPTTPRALGLPPAWVRPGLTSGRGGECALLCQDCSGRLLDTPEETGMG